MKKLIFVNCILFGLVLLFGYSISYAQVYSAPSRIELTKLPGTNGAVIINPTSTSPMEYISTIYNSGIAIGSILAVVMIVAGGVMWSASAAVDKKSEGKDMILNALFGLVVLLSSWLILKTINPALVQLEPPGGIVPINIESCPPGQRLIENQQICTSTGEFVSYSCDFPNPSLLNGADPVTFPTGTWAGILQDPQKPNSSGTGDSSFNNLVRGGKKDSNGNWRGCIARRVGLGPSNDDEIKYVQNLFYNGTEVIDTRENGDGQHRAVVWQYPYYIDLSDKQSVSAFNMALSIDATLQQQANNLNWYNPRSSSTPSVRFADVKAEMEDFLASGKPVEHSVSEAECLVYAFEEYDDSAPDMVPINYWMTPCAGGSTQQNTVATLSSADTLIAPEDQVSSIDMSSRSGVQYANGVALFGQGSEPWGSKAYGKIACAVGNPLSTIRSSGCGATSLAMAIRTLTNDSSVWPDTIASELEDNGGRPDCGGGTNWTGVFTVTPKHGLSISRVDTAGAISCLRDGGLVYYSSRPSMGTIKDGKDVGQSGCTQSPTFTKAAHYILLTKYNSDSNISFNDPNGAKTGVTTKANIASCLGTGMACIKKGSNIPATQNNGTVACETPSNNTACEERKASTGANCVYRQYDTQNRGVLSGGCIEKIVMCTDQSIPKTVFPCNTRNLSSPVDGKLCVAIATNQACFENVINCWDNDTPIVQIPCAKRKTSSNAKICVGSIVPGTLCEEKTIACKDAGYNPNSNTNPKEKIPCGSRTTEQGSACDYNTSKNGCCVRTSPSSCN